MKFVILVVLGGLLFIAIKFGVVGASGLAVHRRETPIIFWIGFLGLLFAFLAGLASMLGLW